MLMVNWSNCEAANMFGKHYLELKRFQQESGISMNNT